MRSTDERVSAVLGRAQARENATIRRRRRAVALGGGALCVVAVVAVAIGIASAGPTAGPMPSGPLGLMGSVFSDNAALGYIVVGLLGLALGVAITVLAYRVGRKPGRMEARRAAPPDDGGDGRSEP